MDHCYSQLGSAVSCCDITAEPRIGDIRRRHDRYVIFVLRLMMGRVACVVRGEGRGGGACVGLKEARFEPPLLIADAVVQELIVATRWTFLTAANPNVRHAQLLKYLRRQMHYVLFVLLEHTQTLL